MKTEEYHPQVHRPGLSTDLPLVGSDLLGQNHALPTIPWLEGIFWVKTMLYRPHPGRKRPFAGRWTRGGGKGLNFKRNAILKMKVVIKVVGYCLRQVQGPIMAPGKPPPGTHTGMLPFHFHDFQGMRWLLVIVILLFGVHTL
jgi:hypothetical protein